MTFTRVNAGGWAANAILTTAQMNQLDSDHVMSADKSIAGDTILGTWVFSSGVSGLTFSGSSKGVQLNSFQAVNLAFAPGIKTTANGGISLGGGANDWIVFNSTQNRTVFVGADSCAGLVSDVQYGQGVIPAKFVYNSANRPTIGNTVTVGVSAMVTTASGAGGNPWVYILPIRPLHNGAQLNNVTIYLQPANHASLPTVMPAIEVLYSSQSAAQIGTLLGLSGGLAVDPSATAGAYNAAHSFTINLNQNNTIDTTQFSYWLAIWDEAGTNAIAGNRYFGMGLNYTMLDTRFP